MKFNTIKPVVQPNIIRGTFPGAHVPVTLCCVNCDTASYHFKVKGLRYSKMLRCFTRVRTIFC